MVSLSSIAINWTHPHSNSSCQTTQNIHIISISISISIISITISITITPTTIIISKITNSSIITIGYHQPTSTHHTHRHHQNATGSAPPIGQGSYFPSFAKASCFRRSSSSSREHFTRAGWWPAFLCVVSRDFSMGKKDNIPKWQDFSSF